MLANLDRVLVDHRLTCSCVSARGLRTTIHRAAEQKVGRRSIWPNDACHKIKRKLITKTEIQIIQGQQFRSVLIRQPR